MPFDGSDLITVDFETYWDAQFSLKKIPIVPYVRDPRFLSHGVGIKVNDGPSVWYPRTQAREVLHRSTGATPYCFVRIRFLMGLY